MDFKPGLSQILAPELVLEKRAGLPDHLRVLVEEYPRADWSDHPKFRGMAEFWLERHMMFRQIMERMKSDARAHFDGHTETATHGARLSRLGSLFIQQLHGHHTIEDQQFFPQLSQFDSRVAGAFEILDADHHTIDGHLQTFANVANTVIELAKNKTGEAKNSASDTGKNTKIPKARINDATGHLCDTLEKLEALLNRHLVDEEEIVIPVLLKFG